MVRGLRWAVSRWWTILLQATELCRAAVWRCSDLVRRRLAVHLDLVKARPSLLCGRLLHTLVFFPLSDALRRCAAWPLLPLACSSIGSILRVRWRRSTVCDLRCDGVGVMLIRRPGERATRCGRSSVHQRSDLRSWARLTSVWRHRALSCRRLHTIRWRRHAGRRTTKWRRALHWQLRWGTLMCPVRWMLR